MDGKVGAEEFKSMFNTEITNIVSQHSNAVSKLASERKKLLEEKEDAKFKQHIEKNRFKFENFKQEQGELSGSVGKKMTSSQFLCPKEKLKNKWYMEDLMKVEQASQDCCIF